QERGAIVFVDDRIYFDNFHGDHGFAVGDHFHGEVGFTIGGAAADGGADSGGIAGIDEIHVQAYRDAVGIVHGVLEGVGHDFAHAALIDFTHGEGLDSEFLDEFLFVGVEIAYTD